MPQACVADEAWPESHQDWRAALTGWTHLGTAKIAAAGHRIVHVDLTIFAPEIVTPELITTLNDSQLAPLHQNFTASPPCAP
jgi:acetate kinase